MNVIRYLFFYALIFIEIEGYSQLYPSFGDEKEVTINGLITDAMEPFISPDGNSLFFNSLNSGGNTNLYWASRVNDTTFNFVGLVNGTLDTSSNHLDAVASLDTLNNFVWVSLRDYPLQMENLHRGTYAAGSVTNSTRIYGDFNINEFNYPYGWLIMDASISIGGEQLYYCNAKFDFSNTTCVGVPCDSKLGVAQKVNDSIFNKISTTELIFGQVNDTLNYIQYAPQVTYDGLELYFTRVQKGTFNTEVCVSVRNNTADYFSTPIVIHSNLGYLPEAASPTTDKQMIYYHQKNETNVYRIYMRYRTGTLSQLELGNNEWATIYPNPAIDFLQIEYPHNEISTELIVYSCLGQKVNHLIDQKIIDISNLEKGMYILTVTQGTHFWTSKFIKN